jgi:hypothetical protein
MLTFAFAFVFHMVAGMNPCTDNSKFTGELVHNEQKCGDVAGKITSFTPSLATCQETVASLGGASRFEVLGMMRVCCQNSATLCDPFRPKTTTAAPHATGMTCIQDFQGSYELGGRSMSDNRLGTKMEQPGHGHLLCEGVNVTGGIVRTTTEFRAGNIGMKTGWQSANPFGEARFNLVEVNGVSLTFGTLAIKSGYEQHKICGSGQDVWQFADAMVIENTLSDSATKITGYAFLNEATKNTVMAGETLFSVPLAMGSCKLEVVVAIPVNANGDTTFAVEVMFHRDEGEEELNNGLRLNSAGEELIIESDSKLGMADGTNKTMTMAKGVVCAKTKTAVPASAITLTLPNMPQETRFVYSVARSAVAECEMLYWDPTMTPYGGDQGGVRVGAGSGAQPTTTGAQNVSGAQFRKMSFVICFLLTLLFLNCRP